MTLLLIVGVGVLLLGAVVLLVFPERPGGTISIGNLGNVNSTGAGLPIIVLGLATIGYASLHTSGGDPPSHPTGSTTSTTIDETTSTSTGRTSTTSPLFTQAGAVVTAEGRMVRASAMAGPVTASRAELGKYFVKFSRDVRSCVYFTTLGNPGAGSVPPLGFITVASDANTPAGVFVAVKDAHGAAMDASFQLVTICSASHPWAVVSSDAKIARASGTVGAVTASRIGAGRYNVGFERDVRSCVFTATIGSPGGGFAPSPGFIGVASQRGAATGVFVAINDIRGQPMDAPFHVSVNCSRTDPWAVIGDHGLLVRSSGISGAVTASRLTSGQYQILFDRDVRSCVYVATLGDAATGPAPGPGLARVASRLNAPAGVFVMVNDAAGRALDAPLHLITVC